jgi:hypothetical protein
MVNNKLSFFKGERKVVLVHEDAEPGRWQDKIILMHGHVGVYNLDKKGYPMDNLQRVNLMLERRQREANENTPQKERKERLEALENAHALSPSAF